MDRQRTLIGSITTLALALGSVGVSAQDDAATPSGAAPPSQFDGVITCGPQIRAGTTTSTRIDAAGDGPAVMVVNRGYAWTPPITSMSDERLQGTLYNSFDSVAYGPDDDRSYGTGTWRIVNDEGAWEGSFHGLRLNDGDSWASNTYPLYGEGAYEGLVALMAWDYTLRPGGNCLWEVKGVIIDGELPAAPTPAS